MTITIPSEVLTLMIALLVGLQVWEIKAIFRLDKKLTWIVANCKRCKLDCQEIEEGTEIVVKKGTIINE